jgi:YidC/Oxa1 family membrane protein insertase
MDIKRILTALLISAAVMFLLLRFFPDLFGSKPAATNSSAATMPSETATQAATAASTATAMASAPAPLVATENAPPPIAPQQFIHLGSAARGAPYKLELVVNNVHASVEVVQLNIGDYAETVQKKDPLTLLKADPRAPLEPFATTNIKVDGADVSLLKNLAGAPLTWYVDKDQTSDVKTTLYAIIYTDMTFKKPWLRVEKTFQIDPASYDVTISHRVVNQTATPVNVQIDQMGPTSLWNKPPDDLRSDSRTFQTATYNKIDQYLYTEKDTTKLVYQRDVAKSGADMTRYGPLGGFGGDDRTVWVAASNRFFTTIVRPLPRFGALAEPLRHGGAVGQIDYLDSAQMVQLYIDSAEPAESIAGTFFAGKPLTISANDSATMALSVFMGPKKKQILTGDSGAPPTSSAYAYNIYEYMGVIQIARGGCYSIIPFIPKLAFIILQLLDWIHYVTFNWGIATIILVIIVRLLMHPLTRSSQINMAKMQQKMAAIQPELERVKKKYPKDTTMQNQEKMRVFKENNINPAGSILGCLPMMLQMPIWAALYAGLAIDIDLRQAGFIPGWITDLANPDMIIGRLSHPYFTAPLLGAVYGLNLLPILLGLVFFFQMRYSMKSAPKPADEQTAQTQKISQFMFLLFPIMLYNAPSGLNLYIFSSSVAGFFDTWLIRRHMKAMGILPAAMSPTL